MAPPAVANVCRDGLLPVLLAERDGDRAPLVQEAPEKPASVIGPAGW